MSIVEKLKARLKDSTGAPLEAISQPMLDRISERVAGGQVPVWCKASWGSGCDTIQQSVSKPSV